MERATQSRRLGEYVAAAAFGALAVAVSPVGIELVTGRTALTFRVTWISFAVAAFLLTISGAILAQGRIRRLFFALMAMTFPFAALACLESTAVALHLADRVAPLEDISILDPGKPYPAYLLSTGRWQPGQRLYRPWQAPGVLINADGLRTQPRTPKAAGEWRIAVTGGSAVWGWRMLDPDTIPGQLQRLRTANVTFYNFGLEGATIAQELATLKQFRELYEIDQAIFYTGANDAFSAYLEVASGQKQLFDATNGIASFELVKAATRLSRTIVAVSAAELEKREAELLPKVQRNNHLREGLLAANNFCTEARLRCDFFLQPLLFTRSPPVGTEVQLVPTFKQFYPGFAATSKWMYQDTLASLPGGRVHDFSGLFDDIAEPVFTDNVHVNQLGNRIVAQRIGAAISFGPE
jgi:hypothetical protein